MPLDKRSLLGRHALFAELRPEELDRLATYMRVVQYPANTVLFRKGDPGTNMMVVVRGHVQISTRSDEGKEFVLNLIDRGDVFGEIALLDGGARTAEAVTLDDCELLVLERRDFLPFLERHPDALMRFVVVLCRRLRRTSELLEETLFFEGASRVARSLAHLADQVGKPVAKGVRIDLRLSQQQLANMVGMTRESINQQLVRWREQGIILIEDRHITITDLERLRAV
jgi:CRP/FNR family cyclic AMP-dependent transcriptional regulator